MKKITLVGLLLFGSLYASEANNTILKENYTTKRVLISMKKVIPSVYTIYNDYFQAKTCSKDIENKITIEQIKNFAASKQFGKLMLLKTSKNKKDTKEYYNLLNTYAYMNCENYIDNKKEQ